MLRGGKLGARAETGTRAARAAQDPRPRTLTAPTSRRIIHARHTDSPEDSSWRSAMRPMIVLVAWCLGVVPALGKTWFVGGSGADFAQIQPAIDIAQDGDVILVRDGTY